MRPEILGKPWLDDLIDKNHLSSDSNMNFCKGPFWNSTLSWHTNDPDLTECFRDTILVSVPCLFLWMFGVPFWAWKNSQTNSKPYIDNKPIVTRPRFKTTISLIFVVKLVSSLFLIMNCVAELYLRINEASDTK